MKYAKTLTFDWHQLKADGEGQATKVGGTEAHVVIEDPSPSTMEAKGPAKNRKAKATEYVDPKGAERHRDSAVADLDWNSIILHPNNEEIQRLQKSLDDAEGTSTNEGQDAMTSVTDIVCQLLNPPSTRETRALDADMQAHGARIAKLSTPLDDVLEKTRELEEKQREQRGEALQPLVRLIRKKAPAKADELVGRMTQALEAGNPSASYKPFLGGLIERDRAQDDNLVYQLTRQSRGNAHLEPKGLGKRPRNPLEGNLRTTQTTPQKTRRVIRETESSSGAEQMARVLINIKDKQLDWKKAESLAGIDRNLHHLVTFLVEGPFDQEFLEHSLQGHSTSTKFSKYLSQMEAIPEFQNARESART